MGTSAGERTERLWQASGMPWIPELFSAPVLERIQTQTRGALAAVPYFEGMTTGETDALVGSFAGEPEIHHPVRGRVKGRAAFERFVADTNAWLFEHDAVITDVERIVTPSRGIEEAILTLDGHIDVPVAIAADRDDDAGIVELRVYYSLWPLTGRHAGRPPLLQPDPDIHAPDVVGEYQHAFAAGDTDAILAAFGSDCFVREPSGGRHVHRGEEELRALYRRFFSNGSGVALEHCTVTDDGHACALEYNLPHGRRTEIPAQAGIVVHVRDGAGKLASVRIYDDSDGPGPA
jgi:hypothetical protein